MKLTKLCPICGGRGKFLGSLCQHCKGIGGSLCKNNEAITDQAEDTKLQRLSEQETKILRLYNQKLSLIQIATEMDLTQPQTLLLFHKIEKKLSEDFEEL